jgi:adenine deaminase
LLNQGSIDYIVRSAVGLGVDPITAIRAATINPAEYFRLYDRGAVVPGKRADLVVFSDLNNIQPEQVYRGGRLAAEHGHMLYWEQPVKSTKTRGTINVRWDKLNFSIPAEGKRIRVIGLRPDELITDSLVEDAFISSGYVISNSERNLTKLAVIERHLGSGRVGLGFIKGLGLRKGAIASTIAHDSHNIIVAGMDDESMLTAVKTITAMQGGMVAVEKESVLEQLPLPIAGLMSDQPIEVVAEQHNRLMAAACSLGSSLHDPFMAIGFMALPVIPSLKLTDLGLVDVDRFELTRLFIS